MAQIKAKFSCNVLLCSMLAISFLTSGCSDWGNIVRGVEAACGRGEFECMQQTLDNLEAGEGQRYGFGMAYSDMLFPGPSSNYMRTGSIAFVLAEAENVAEDYTPAELRRFDINYQTQAPGDIENIFYLAEMMILTRHHFGDFTEGEATTELRKVIRARERVRYILEQLDEARPHTSFADIQREAAERAESNDDEASSSESDPNISPSCDPSAPPGSYGSC